ncbi:MAG: ATP-grasp domain-containing protein [Dehalococcoidales bacterium]|nr:ATP-grasp domain-containing protein [Dehalococcoidales bacterium]
MHSKIGVIYNQPDPGRYGDMGEDKAIIGVLDEMDAVHEALIELGYEVVRLPLVPPLELARTELSRLKVDLVFNLFEGFDGRPETEANVAEMLAQFGLPHTGCPAHVIALAQDKVKTGALLEASGVDVPGYQLLNPETVGEFRLAYPCIVKPSGEHASHGLSEKSVVNDFASLEAQVIKVSELFGGQALVEEFLDGREFNITVLGDADLTVLPVSEIVYSLPAAMPRILTFAAKWEPDSLYFQGTKAVCPADIGAELNVQIAATARAVFKLFGCRGYARVDMRVGNDNRLKVLELNPNPDISPDTGAARQAKAAGLTYSEFIEKIVALALDK